MYNPFRKGSIKLFNEHGYNDDDPLNNLLFRNKSETPFTAEKNSFLKKEFKDFLNLQQSLKSEDSSLS
jgi:hypothetical protein